MAGHGGYRYDDGVSMRQARAADISSRTMQAHAGNIPPTATSEWDLSSLGPMQRLRALGGFFAAYALLVHVGYVLKENAGSLTIIWPAAGLLFITLVATPIRQWSWIVALQLAAELAVGT